MGLLTSKCRTCKRQISMNAKTCPHCGDTDANGPGPIHWVILIVIVVIVIAAIA